MDSNRMENDFVNYTSHLFNERPYVDDTQGNVTDTSEESRLISTLDIDQAERRKKQKCFHRFTILDNYSSHYILINTSWFLVH